MTTLLYDGTFEGLMTAIFEVYEYRFEPVKIIANEKYESESIFTDHHTVITNQEKADRVLKKVETNLGKKGVSQGTDCGCSLCECGVSGAGRASPVP